MSGSKALSFEIRPRVQDVGYFVIGGHGGGVAEGIWCLKARLAFLRDNAPSRGPIQEHAPPSFLVVMALVGLLTAGSSWNWRSGNPGVQLAVVVAVAVAAAAAAAAPAPARAGAGAGAGAVSVAAAAAVAVAVAAVVAVVAIVVVVALVAAVAGVVVMFAVAVRE